MQNLTLPCIPVQETFYLRQLTVSVFCIHNLKDNSVTFFLYHEGTACKGPNEVSSFFLSYIEDSLKNIDHLHIFSDGCGGQNKNHTLIRVLSALVTLDKFKSINHYFPVRGHSFLPCDRDFSVLKRKIRKTDRIYTLKEYAELMLHSSKKNDFLVVMPESCEVVDYKNWWPNYYKKNMVSEETSGRHVPRDQKCLFKISKFLQFTHSGTAKNKVQARTFIDGLTVQTFSLKNSNKNELVLPEALAYPDGCVPINKKKLKTLKNSAHTFQMMRQ